MCRDFRQSLLYKQVKKTKQVKISYSVYSSSKMHQELSDFGEICQSSVLKVRIPTPTSHKNTKLFNEYDLEDICELAVKSRPHTKARALGDFALFVHLVA